MRKWINKLCFSARMLNNVWLLIIVLEKMDILKTQLFVTYDTYTHTHTNKKIDHIYTLIKVTWLINVRLWFTQKCHSVSQVVKSICSFRNTSGSETPTIDQVLYKALKDKTSPLPLSSYNSIGTVSHNKRAIMKYIMQQDLKMGALPSVGSKCLPILTNQ